MAAAGAAAIDETTTGLKQVTLVAETGQSLTVTGGENVFVWGALHIGVQASTAAVFRFGPGTVASAVNANLAAATARMGTHAGHASNNLTTIGTSTPANITLTTQLIWMALR